MNIELRPEMKRRINELLGWDAASEVDEMLEEEDIEEIEDLADEVAMDEWMINGVSREDFEQAIKAHRAKMMEYGGKKLQRKCRLQEKYVNKAAEAEFAPVARTLKERAADKRCEIRMDVKKLLAHSQRARKLRTWMGALTSTNVKAGDDIDLEEISPDVKERLTDPAHDELSPEMEEAQIAVEMQMEEDGADRAFEEIEEQVEEVEEKGDDAEIDISLDDDIEELEETEEVSTMFQEDL